MAITVQQAVNYIEDNFPAINTHFSGPYILGDGRVEITKNRNTDTTVMERFYIDLSNGIYFHEGRYGEYFGSGVIPSDYRGESAAG